MPIYLSHLKDFYALLALQLMADNGNMSHAWEKFREANNEFLDDLAESLSLAMRDYLVLAAFGESRHSISESGKHRCPEFPLFTDGISRGEAMRYAVDYDPQLALPKLVALFDNDNWKNPSSIGGERWGQIARGALSYWTDYKDKPIAFIDHIADIRHNNGTAFSKEEAAGVLNESHMTEWLGNGGVSSYLNAKACCKPDELIFGGSNLSGKYCRVMLNRTSALASRYKLLSNDTREVQALVWEGCDGSLTHYVPIVWGTKDLTILEKPSRGYNMVAKLRISMKADWSVVNERADKLKKATHASVAAAMAAMDEFQVWAKAQANELSKPWEEQYPSHAKEVQHNFRLEVDRIVYKLKEVVYARFVEQEGDRILAEVRKMWDIWAKEYTCPYPPSRLGIMAIDDAVSHKQDQVNYFVHQALKQLPISIMDNVDSYVTSDMRKIRQAAHNSVLQSIYGSSNRYEILSILERAEVLYRAFCKGTVARSGNPSRPLTVARKLEQCRMELDQELRWISPDLRKLAHDYFEQKVTARIAELDSMRQNPIVKEVVEPSKKLVTAPVETHIYATYSAASAAYVKVFYEDESTH